MNKKLESEGNKVTNWESSCDMEPNSKWAKGFSMWHGITGWAPCGKNGGGQFCIKGGVTIGFCF